MNILIKAAIIIDESTKHHLKKRDEDLNTLEISLDKD